MQPSRAWERDKASADRFLPEARRVLADYFIQPATVAKDQEEATDLVVLTVAPFTVAWRNRSNERRDYLADYPDDVTIRFSRPTGALTEYPKVMSGWASHMLYTFGDAASLRILAYRLMDLDAFRTQESRRPPEDQIMHARKRCPSGRADFRLQPNPDGTTFRAYDARTFAHGVVLCARGFSLEPFDFTTFVSGGLATCGRR